MALGPLFVVFDRWTHVLLCLQDSASRLHSVLRTPRRSGTEGEKGRKSLSVWSPVAQVRFQRKFDAPALASHSSEHFV